MKNKKEVALAIELARQQLEFAVDAKDRELESRLLVSLMHLYGSQDEIVREEEEKMVKIARGENSNVISMHKYKASKVDTKRDLILVYSGAYPDGLLCTEDAYRAICRLMDKCDRETHQRVLVDPEMAASLTETLNEIITLEDVLSASKTS